MKKILEALFLACIAISLALGIAANIISCEHDGCKTESMRCRNNNVEQCNADKDWYVVEHCDNVAPASSDWVCCDLPDQDLVACLPSAACETYDGGQP